MAAKEAKCPFDAVASPLVIAAMAIVMDGLKIKISIKAISVGGRIGQRWLVSAEKILE